MSQYIIKVGHLFYVGQGSKGVRLSPEYPDAEVFTKIPVLQVTEARKKAPMNTTIEVLRSYGMRNEQSVLVVQTGGA